MKLARWIFMMAAALAGGALQAQETEVLSLSLEQALQRAREASPRLRALAARSTIAEAGAARARAALKPDLDATARYSRLSDVPEFGFRQPDGSFRILFPNIPDQYVARVGVGVPLYAGGSLRAALDAAQQEVAAAGHDVETGAAELELEVTEAYWGLVVVRERQRVLAEAIGTFEAHLTDTRNRRKFGLAAANEELAVTLERDRARLAEIEAERDLAIAQANLGRLLDLPIATQVEPSASLAIPPAEPTDAEALVRAALETRPERTALMARLAAAEAAVAVERGKRKPQLRATAGYDLAQPNARILPPEDELNDSWDVSFLLSYNLFDGGKRAAEVARAEARVEVLRQDLEMLERAVRLEVVARRLELEAARAAIAVAEGAIGLAVENVRVAGERYREGLVPSSEWLDTETALLRAGLEKLLAQAQAHLAQTRLDRAVGER